nr:immunoglobulin light chain junction region [Macaca mulatta]MPO03100.1 immunoglobulin light chain junction region [Macaca mulatta]MPO03115.1 immunoglobulin light chain junction region [Macaca mulatta]MPO03156.1 immunoglobulin light chain junction region [Macaca mulatta]MPO03185.1 immunoglobulin light chain junction region [Macaca mulatta]
CMIWHNNAYIF